jgi:MFS transporter, putative metabolite:H+ symporter
MYFAGWVTTLIFLPAISDRKGRKWFAFVFTLIQFAIFIFLYFTHSLIVCMYLIGFGLTGKVTILYVYITEFLPASKRNLYATLLNCFDGGTMIWSSLYFAYIPYWKPFFIFVLAIHVVIIINLLFIPESPIVLYENERY